MEPDLSEFSYGFALTSELIAKWNLKRFGAPEFATQKAEAKVGGGWDVKLPGFPIYLQFKRSDRMERRTANEAYLFPRFPFFRMHLRRKDISHQHQLMLDLETSGKHVFYAGPGFADGEELSQLYINDSVCRSSVFVRPSEIGPLMDNKKHHVAFQIGGKAYFCSEPREIETVVLDEFITTKIAQQKVEPDGIETSESLEQKASKSFDQEAENLLQIYESRAAAPSQRRIVGNIRQLRDRRTPSEFMAQVARTLFEVEILFVPKKGSE